MTVYKYRQNPYDINMGTEVEVSPNDSTETQIELTHNGM